MARTEEELAKLVTRVIAEVAKEAAEHEGLFGVQDLVREVAKLREVGGESAWKITYDTSGSSIEQLRRVAKLGGESTWTITYDTSGSSIEQVKK